MVIICYNEWLISALYVIIMFLWIQFVFSIWESLIIFIPTQWKASQFEQTTLHKRYFPHKFTQNILTNRADCLNILDTWLYESISNWRGCENNSCQVLVGLSVVLSIMGVQLTWPDLLTPQDETRAWTVMHLSLLLFWRKSCRQSHVSNMLRFNRLCKLMWVWQV